MKEPAEPASANKRTTIASNANSKKEEKLKRLVSSGIAIAGLKSNSAKERTGKQLGTESSVKIKSARKGWRDAKKKCGSRRRRRRSR